jgi:hypothetical protein
MRREAAAGARWMRSAARVMLPVSAVAMNSRTVVRSN